MDYVLCPKCNSSRLAENNDGRQQCLSCLEVCDTHDVVHVQYWLWSLVHEMELAGRAYVQVAKPSPGGPFGYTGYYPGHLISGTGV